DAVLQPVGSVPSTGHLGNFSLCANDLDVDGGPDNPGRAIALAELAALEADLPDPCHSWRCLSLVQGRQGTLQSRRVRSWGMRKPTRCVREIPPTSGPRRANRHGRCVAPQPFRPNVDPNADGIQD